MLATPTNHFQVGNCRLLDYEPKLSLTLSGGLARRGHPAIHAVLDAGPGEANTRRVSVALPGGELLDNRHIDTVCTRVQFAADACPAGSVLGTAEAKTPLLDAPLSGKVYLRSGPNKLPDLVVDLQGQIDIVLVGKIDTVSGGSLRTTFTSVPDAPVEEFRLDLAGGKKGLLQNSRPICGRKLRATVRMIGQNGARSRQQPSAAEQLRPGAEEEDARGASGDEDRSRLSRGPFRIRSRGRCRGPRRDGDAGPALRPDRLIQWLGDPERLISVDEHRGQPDRPPCARRRQSPLLRPPVRRSRQPGRLHLDEQSQAPDFDRR